MTDSFARPRRTARLAAVAAGLAAAACAPTVSPNSAACPSHSTDFRRPSQGPMVGYALFPKTISYHFLDVRVDTVEYTWDTSQTYAGLACLRFQGADTLHMLASGSFQLLQSGSNAAYMRRHLTGGGATVNDTVIGYVFSGCEGTGGTYSLRSDSTLALTWTDGTQSLILGPNGLHQLEADTIWSSVTVSTHADSLHGAWRFGWVRGYCRLGL